MYLKSSSPPSLRQYRGLERRKKRSRSTAPLVNFGDRWLPSFHRRRTSRPRRQPAGGRDRRCRSSAAFIGRTEHVGRTVLCAGPRSQKDAPPAASAADVRYNRRLKRATTARRAGKDRSSSRNCKAPRTLPAKSRGPGEFPGKWRFTQWCSWVGVHARAAAGGAPSAEQRRERDVIQRHGLGAAAQWPSVQAWRAPPRGDRDP